MTGTCWVCDQPANASCRFCGRFICRDHASTLPFFLSIYVGENDTPKAIVVSDAIWCGICRPQPEPIEMPEIY
jgi:hypothetical protein